jgi:hypothetical protein
MHLEMRRIMRLEHFDQQQQSRMIVKVVREIADANFTGCGAIEAEGEIVAYLMAPREAVLCPKLGTVTLLPGADAGHRQKLERRKLARYSLRQNSAHALRLLGEFVPLTHFAASVEGFHCASRSARRLCDKGAARHSPHECGIEEEQILSQ